MSLVRRRLRLLASVLFISLATTAQWIDCQPAAAQSSDQVEFFEKRIRPILTTNCTRCHNSEAHLAKLDLTSAEGFAKGAESGALIDPAKPEESRLLKVISYDESLKMPPTGKLKADDLAAVTAWVKIGAPWPKTTDVTAETESTRSKSTREFTEEERAFWAFQPLNQHHPPKVRNSRWVKSPIDAFVLKKLEERGLSPAPPADKLTLLRRASYDLTGLPPTEEEMRKFLSDKTPQAFFRVVERLLASPRYGEKWGRHWLDVARYADSTGNDEDHRYPHAWRYRDYVIESFNNDVPYDHFVREQIAGDLLPASDGVEVNKRGIVATGFLALGAKAIAQQDKQKMLYDVWDEQVDVTSKAFLGLTMACARCHNHKFDPILTKDYYALVGIFAGTRSFSNPNSHVSVVLEKPLVPKADWQQYQTAKRAHSEREKRARLALESITDEVKNRVVKQYCSSVGKIMLAARSAYEGGVTTEDAARQGGIDPAMMQKWIDFLKPDPERVRGYLNEWNAASPDRFADVARAYQVRFVKRFEEWQAVTAAWQSRYQQALSENKPLPDKPKFEEGEDRFFNDLYFGDGPFKISAREKNNFTSEQWAEIQRLHKTQDELKKAAPPEPDLACAIEEGEPVQQRVLVRGDYNSPGEEAPPAFPAILARYDLKSKFSGSGRLQLAEWLTNPRNPLPKRVMVNRIWQWHFGEGIVRTPDNFGKTGDLPSHSELLDFLADQFVKQGYSIKALHRLMMLSSSYQMASENPATKEADPDNRLLSRFNRRRLTIEEMRDGLLAIDGTLDLTMGGTLQTGRGTDAENNQGRLSLNPEKLNRRTVYLPLRRANLPTLLNLFDFGDATTVSGRRQLTNVATQALFWLNSDFLTDCSRRLAQILRASNTMNKSEGVASAYRRILNRRALPDEVARGVKYIEGFKQSFPGDRSEEKAWQSFYRILMSSNDFLYVE